MKKIKLFFTSVIAVMLVGCGGHGYEGEYSIEFQDAFFGKKQSGGSAVMVLGSDYMELDGDRTEFDSIKVVDGRLLLETDGKQPETLKIIDDSTIVMDAGFGVMKFTKI
ncbi:hypothetical protein ACFFLZ_01340 [Photobacterium aphoticum]|uniref:Lipoprotein n=1 Tax=Photobacterium aphoticum TaxID=754436 RepID=A0A0J1GJM4_9GAMM|nr:hypothetical protein [Photobacterium aphoticum]KLU99942.1 hypothetical protein ABT58_15625 [Photobacterium aphoticum]GHA40820.1 hypothetical protein GCM10007086_13060 [Photobacterium aphoticum]